MNFFGLATLFFRKKLIQIGAQPSICMNPQLHIQEKIHTNQRKIGDLYELFTFLQIPCSVRTKARRNVQQAGQWNAVGAESGPHSPGSRPLPPSRLRQRCAHAHEHIIIFQFVVPKDIKNKSSSPDGELLFYARRRFSYGMYDQYRLFARSEMTAEPMAEAPMSAVATVFWVLLRLSPASLTGLPSASTAACSAEKSSSTTDSVVY